jgi:hypothetical protein
MWGGRVHIVFITLWFATVGIMAVYHRVPVGFGMNV